MSRKPPLTPAGITDAAIAIADGEGLDAVSMRRLAGDLGVSAMALYRHVADRSDLLLLMARAATAEFSLLPAGIHTWQQMLAHMADAQWAAFSAHPWLLRIVLTPRRLVNMASPGDVERILSTLASAGLAEEQGFDCLLGISAAVIGTSSITAAAHYGPVFEGQPAAADGGQGEWKDGTMVTRHPRAARFQQQGITYAGSRRSLDFFVANFIAGVEQTLTHTQGSPTGPAIWKEQA